MSEEPKDPKGKREAERLEPIGIGRIVHFVQEVTGDHCAAMVIAVKTRFFARAVVTLAVTGPTGDRWTVNDCSQDETAQRPRSWHWPERFTEKQGGGDA